MVATDRHQHDKIVMLPSCEKRRSEKNLSKGKRKAVHFLFIEVNNTEKSILRFLKNKA